MENSGSFIGWLRIEETGLQELTLYVKAGAWGSESMYSRGGGLLIAQFFKACPGN